MKVYVVGLNGLGLAPTTPRKARLLLREGKAMVHKKVPFTIRLLYKTGCAHIPLNSGVDTGSQHIGFAAVTRTDTGKVLSKEEYELRSMMEKRKLIEKKKTFRRGRRHRKVRYRHPRFKPKTRRVYSEKKVKRNGHMTHWVKVKNEFPTRRQEGWLPPSMQSKLDHHTRLIDCHMEILPPDTEFHIEVGRFDVQQMIHEDTDAELYRRRPMYKEENVRAFVFARDGYKCQCCKAKGGTKREDGTTVKLIKHHIDFKSQGATDNPARQITVCDECHTTKNHEPGGILYQWMLDGKKVSRGYRDTTVMNILRCRLMERYPGAVFTYGNITAADRKMLGIEKSHANDAVAIAAHGMEKVIDQEDVVCYKQIRKQKRSLHESKARKGLKGKKNTTAERRRKNVPQAKGYWLNDTVRVYGETGYISGFSGTSGAAYVKRPDGTYVTQPEKNYKTVQLSQVRYIHHNNNWYCYIDAGKKDQ